MKSKFYWEQHDDTAPFELPRRIAYGINACRKQQSKVSPAPASVRYIWIYLTHSGLQHGHFRSSCDPELSLDDWLNIIDESAALGAEWVMFYVGASLSECSLVWKLCEWAQQTHGLNVGLHLRCNCLSEEDAERLSRLDHDRTFVVADGELSNTLRTLQERGINICQADLHLHHKMSRCTKPADIACVAPNGRMYSCGLVLGDQEFAMGDAREHRLVDVMNDQSLPHAIDDMTRHQGDGCSGCPSLVAAHLGAAEH